MVGIVLKAWRQLYLFMSKPRRLPLQTGAELSASNEKFDIRAGRSCGGDAGLWNVSFIGDANSRELVRSWKGGRVSVRVTEVRNGEIQPM